MQRISHKYEVMNNVSEPKMFYQHSEVSIYEIQTNTVNFCHVTIWVIGIDAFINPAGTTYTLLLVNFKRIMKHILIPL